MTLDVLNAHLYAVTQLHSARESLHSVQAKVLGAQKLDGMPHANNASRNTENLSILLEKQLDNVARLERIVKRSEESGIRSWIEAIPDNRTMLIFNLRFLCGMEWIDVAAFIGGRNTAESVKAVCYRYLQVNDST